METLDDQFRETVNRLLESLRGQLESTVGSHHDHLVKAARDEHARRDLADREAEQARLRLADEIHELQRSVGEQRAAAEERQRQLDQAHREAAAAREDAAVARAETVTTRNELIVARDEVSAARAEIASLTDHLRHTNERYAQAQRLPLAVRELDTSASFGGVLETLTRHAASEAGRAAVFLVKGDRLREWQSVGFERPPHVAGLDLALSDSGLLAEAVESGAGVPPTSRSVVPNFARTDSDRAVSAWPVTVGGSVAAVLYADAPIADKPNEPYWPAFLEALSRHAGRVLEGITIRHAAGLLTGPAAAISPAVRRQAFGSIQ